MFPYETSLVRETRVEDASHCTLEYDPDPDRWPWLALPCWHPVVAEKYAYFSGVTAGLAVGVLQPATFTALTGMQWSYHGDTAGARYPLRARCRSLLEDSAAAYSVDARDAADRTLFRIEGQGVIFRNRDFDAWREQRRRLHGEDGNAARLDRAGAGACGVTDAAVVRIGAYDAEKQVCLALLTRADGFHPGHPYHTGSGDHVNAAQLLDCASQAAHAVLLHEGLRAPDSGALVCLGGKARFRNYIELGTIFSIRLTKLLQEEPGAFDLRFDLHQHEAVCARLTLRFAAG